MSEGDPIADILFRWQSEVVTLFDENAAVLRDMENRGVDLSYLWNVEFSHVFLTQRDADAFVQACLEKGFKAEDTTDDQMDHFDVTVSKVMTPSCHQITETEEVLGELAEQHKGRSDGWGFISN